MLLLCITMFVICLIFKWANLPIQIGDSQIIIFVIIGAFITSTIKDVFKDSAKKVYEEKKKEEVEDEFMLPLDITEIVGDCSFFLIIIFAIASVVFMYKIFTDVSIKGLILPVIIIVFSEVGLFLGGHTKIKRKAIPVILYLEADVLNKAILLLGAIILTFVIASIYMLIGMIFLIGILGNSIGGG